MKNQSLSVRYIYYIHGQFGTVTERREYGMVSYTCVMRRFGYRLSSSTGRCVTFFYSAAAAVSANRTVAHGALTLSVDLPYTEKLEYKVP